MVERLEGELLTTTPLLHIQEKSGRRNLSLLVSASQ